MVLTLVVLYLLFDFIISKSFNETWTYKILKVLYTIAWMLTRPISLLLITVLLITRR